ncbi:protein LNK2 [Impatiens glandulifera]|uniref:protein LNK2 n=1 Tax=Impatiens glandulifera TaxID=253017 RepID=UPI001FB0677A|nr:protein LNK2 [Impatiens glandulifera]
MFDWNDEEEGEQSHRGFSGESIKKEWDKEDGKSSASHSVPTCKIAPQHAVHRRNCATRHSMDLWPDLSLSDVSRTDQGSFGTEISNNLTEITELDSSKDVTPQVNNGSEAFQNQDDDRVPGDFLDYGWANIGSFEDLDRIFSNEDSIHGNTSLSNDNELWSCKNVTTSPEKSFPSSLDSLCPDLGAFRSSSNQSEVLVTEFRKSSRSRRKSVERTERKNGQDYQSKWTDYGNQFHQLDRQLVPSILSQQTHLPISNPSQYHPFAYPLINPYQNQYASMPVVPHICLQEDDKKMISSYETSPTDLNPFKITISDANAQPLTMTPQEKIQKLRRRQQMQALLAIQKQQQQYTHQDDSDVLSVAAEVCCSMEGTILHGIQDIIDKLDVNIRLSIRDSLFRLAQSAQKRLSANDKSGSNGSIRADSLRNKDIISTHNSFSEVLETETETNPIDRAVAQLLFHKPLESASSSSGKHPHSPESPGSAILPHEKKKKCSNVYANGISYRKF